MTGPAAPPLDPGLEQLLRRMRLPYIRRAAPEVLATAKAQRWDPAEVLKALLTEEVAGRTAPRWPHGGPPPRSPPGRPSTPGTRPCPRSRPRPRRRCARWNGSAAGRTWWSAGRPALARPSSSKPSARPRSRPASMSPGSPSKRSACWSAGTAPTTRYQAVAQIVRADLVIIDDVGLFPVGADAAEVSTASSKPPTTTHMAAIEPSPLGFDELMPQPGHRHRGPTSHHAHLCQTSGDTVRLSQALTGKGVTPLH